MQIKTFLAHGDMEKLESDINAFLATSGGPPVFTELAIDERRVFVMMGFNDPPPPPSVEPVGVGDPAAAPPAHASDTQTSGPKTTPRTHR